MKVKKFHRGDISKDYFLITGGAGFIGSNIVDYLLKNNAGKVIVLDNLSNGYFENIEIHLKNKNFEFINGDIRDYDLVKNLISKVDYVSHQAALGSVPRSIKDPLPTNSVNVEGFLNILNSSRLSKKLKRLVYASSSSVYGDSIELPKLEGEEGSVLSPYALTKKINDDYAKIFNDVYGFKSIGLRYFNVFGPKQNPLNTYAAVIPIFCKNMLNNQPCLINGDGITSRDFTYIDNVVQANILALYSNKLSKHEVINIAYGGRVSLNELVNKLQLISKKKISPIYGKERDGDVKHSNACIEKAKDLIDYNPDIDFYEGLKYTYNYYSDYLNNK